MRVRLANIDGLRGIAALLVLTQHLCERYASLTPNADGTAHLLEHVLLSFVDLGKVAVVAFFAISGFVVPFSFTAETGGTGFIVSRFFRLYPAYWLSLILAAVLLPIVSGVTLPLSRILVNFTMLQGALHVGDVLPVYWTLFIELIFYCLCFALYKAGRLYSPVTLFLLFCALLALSLAASDLRAHGHQQFPVAMPLYLAVMLLGTMVRLAQLEASHSARRLLPAMFLLLVPAIPGAWLTAYTHLSHRETPIADIVGFYGALALFMWCVKRNAFCGRLPVYVGSVSYAIYLFHPLALDTASFVAARVPGPFGGPLLIVLTLAPTLAIAHFTFVTLEKPMVRLGRKVAAALSTEASSSRVFREGDG